MSAVSLKMCLFSTRTTFKFKPVLYTVIRHHWNKDHKPGPFPRTEKERLAAARKYNLLPSEYTPHPDDGHSGMGDYPKLPLVSDDSKDPYYPYDYPELKRNFQEPIHMLQEVIGEDRYDISKRHRISGREQWLQFIGVVGGFFLIYFALRGVPMFHSVVPKQYPGTKHYTFDPK